MKLFFWKADVFAADQAAGSPAACLLLGAEALHAGQMQAVANELKGFVQEVCFATPMKDSLAVRCFTPAAERMVGGASAFAALAALDDEGCLPNGTVTLRIGQRLHRAERLPTGGWVLDVPPFTVGRGLAWPDDVLRALNLDPLRLDEETGPALLEGDARVLLVPMHTAAALCDLQPDVERLTDLADRERLDSVVVCTADRVRPSSDYRVRVFSPRLGVWEEAASPVANGALARFLLMRGLWRGGRLIIEQGREYRGPNLLTFVGGQGENPLLLEGNVRIRMAGQYTL